MTVHYDITMYDRKGEYTVHVELNLSDDEVREALTDIFIREFFKEVPYTPELRNAVEEVVKQYDVEGLSYDYDDDIKSYYEWRAEEAARDRI